MSDIQWFEQGLPAKDACPLCHTSGNRIALRKPSMRWFDLMVDIARCDGCRSFYLAESDSHLAFIPATENELDAEARFFRSLELANGLDWKIPLLERVRIPAAGSVLDVGCGDGFAIDYCQNAWECGALGLEPSAGGLVGHTRLGAPIEQRLLEPGNEYTHAPYDLIYATEVLEHIPDPVALLKVFATYLKPDGTILLTMPRAENVRADANPGSLNMTISSGLHYFIPSRMATEALLAEAGFEFQDHSAVGNSQIVYASRKPLHLSSAPLDLNERMLSYCRKKLATDLEFRVRLAYLIDAFEMSVRLKLPTDALRIEIEQALAEMNIFMDSLGPMSYRVESCETFADLGALIPFGLPKFLRCRAIGDPNWQEILAANMVICAKGLALDGGLLFLYQGILADHFRILKDLDHPNLFDRAVEIARTCEIGAVAVQG